MNPFWTYGLVRQKNGKIRLWEIYYDEYKNKPFVFGSPAYFWWVIKELKLVIKDLYFQYKYFNRFYTEKELEPGAKLFEKQIIKEFKEIFKNGKGNRLQKARKKK